MSDSWDDMIYGPNVGNTQASLLSPGYATGEYDGADPYSGPAALYSAAGEVGASPYGDLTPAGGGPTSGPFGYGYADGDPRTIDQMIDKPADGWTGPSLDGFVGVSYAGFPGYGIANEQLGQSAETASGQGWVVGSQEVGTGRAPGWRWAHYPHVEQHSPRREGYVDQGVFGDGQEHMLVGHSDQREATRAPVWQQAFASPGFRADMRYLAPGSAIIEAPASMSLSQMLGTLGVTGWGVS